MLDIHTHILWGVDDGASSRDEALALIEMLKSEGVTGIICTPHQDSLRDNSKEILEVYNELKASTDIDIKLGSEIYYYEGMLNDLGDRLYTIDESKYILVEFTTSGYENISEIVYDIKSSGYIPIIAHIERYSYLKRRDYDTIIKNGGLIQVNSKAFTNRKYRRILKYLLKMKYISFIASDCHNISNRRPDFASAKEFIKNKYNDQYDKLFINNFIFDERA